MSISSSQEYQNMLFDLLMGNISPRSVVGTGYKYPLQVASSWIRRQLHNLENPNKGRIDEVTVQTNGKAFTSETKAMQSNTFKALVSGTYKLINSAVVTDYGVMPATGTDGYMIYVVTKFLGK